MLGKWILAVALSAAASASYAEDGERYGDWQVRAVHDEMDTVSQVILMTTFKEIPKPGRGFSSSGELRIGFRILGGTLVSLKTSIGFLGDAYWPRCDYDMSSVSVDGKKAVRLTPQHFPGGCNHVAMRGQAITQMVSGNNARMRIGLTDGEVSLKGFNQAWAKARQLSKR
ncbi:hypothetical protein GQL56_10030 [Pseudomonas putida]|nr:hypothetical protein [Pseudomonas putida]